MKTKFSMIKRFIFCSSAAIAILSGVIANAKVMEQLNYGGVAEPNVKPAFLPLPPGAVEPRGWLYDWASAARDGITGHLDEQHATFRDAWKGTYSPDSPGCNADGTGLFLEQCSYWLDGALRLGYILHDDALVEKVTKRLQLVVDGVNNGGESFIYWKKGKPDKPFDSWAHSHMGRALVAWYSATGDKRILNAMVTAYSNYTVPMGHLEFERDISGLCNIDAMLDAYWFSGDTRLLECAKAAMNTPAVKATINDWDNGKFITGHAVCAYEQIRLPILYYMWTGDTNYKQAACNVFKNFNDDHMLPYGVTSGEEWLSGIGAFRLTETCDITAHLWSSSWFLRILGDCSYADGMERAFFNAAPAPVDREFKTMSYLQSPNRINAQSLPIGWNPDCLRFTPFGNPGVLCCVGAINRIIPTYVTNMWMATYDGGLAATLYGPCEVSAMAGAKTKVKLTCETAYPFEETIRIIVKPEKKVTFPLYFRVPAWCNNFGISVNGKSVKVCEKNGFIRINRKWQKGDNVILTLPMSVQVAHGYETEYPLSSKVYFCDRPSATYEKRRLPYETVSYGPLLFALAIPDKNPNQPMPGAKWQYALDNDEKLNGSDIEVIRKPMPSKWAWQLDSPIALNVPAQAFDWNPTESHALPDAVVPRTNSEIIRLVPYGCTKFRISMFPVTERAWK